MVDGQEGSLDLAIRLSSLLLKLCEVELFPLSRVVTVLFSSDLHREIFFRPLQKVFFPLEGISFDGM